MGKSMNTCEDCKYCMDPGEFSPYEGFCTHADSKMYLEFVELEKKDCSLFKKGKLVEPWVCGIFDSNR